MASINDVRRRRWAETLAGRCHAPEIEAEGALLDWRRRQLPTRESSKLDLLVVDSREYGPVGAALLGGVSSALELRGVTAGGGPA